MIRLLILVAVIIVVGLLPLWSILERDTHIFASNGKFSSVEQAASFQEELQSAAALSGGIIEDFSIWRSTTTDWSVSFEVWVPDNVEFAYGRRALSIGSFKLIWVLIFVGAAGTILMFYLRFCRGGGASEDTGEKEVQG